MRYKLRPQDKVWEPRPGLKLLKEFTEFGPVGAAEFRIEKLELEAIEADLRKRYFKTIPADDRQSVVRSWERLGVKLEGMPRRRANLPKMKLVEQLTSVVQAQERDPFDFEEDDLEVPEIEGELYPEVDGEVTIGQDIAVYTTEKDNLPWVGRVLEVSDSEILIHWFERKKLKLTYEALINKNGSLQVDRIARRSIMFKGISTVAKEKSFQITPTWLRRILEEYQRLDRVLPLPGPSQPREDWPLASL